MISFPKTALEDGGDNEGEINDLLHKERVFRTRETVLRSNVKDFSNIFQILQSLKTKSEGFFLIYIFLSLCN